MVTASARVTEILSAVLADSRGAADSAGILVGLCVRAVPVSGVGLALMTDEGPAGTVAASDGGALGVAGEDLPVSPLADQCAVEALDLAVLPRAVRLDELLPGTEGADDLPQ